MKMGHYGNDTDKERLKYSKKKLSQFYFFYK
jgi:hypothetical protein